MHVTPLLLQQQPPDICITLIGMPGAGKSTIAKALGEALQWAVVDSDYVIESVYGSPLQHVTDSLGKDAFLRVEDAIIRSLRLSRAVIATGGSVVYCESSMRHLSALGPIIYLDVNFTLLCARIREKPDRGIAIAPGQTLEDLFHEREVLYQKYATHAVAADTLTPQQCALTILKKLDLSPPDVA